MNTNCPYCAESISKESMLLYFVDDDRFHTIEKLCASGNEEVFITHNCEGSRYKRHWDPRNIKAQGEKGIVIDMKKLRTLLGEKNDGEIEIDENPDNNIKVHLDFNNPAGTFFCEPAVNRCKPKAYLCPHCWNFFPLNYFDYDNYTILLIAPTNTGKSAYSAALLANVCQRIAAPRIPINSERLTCQLNEILCDTIQRESSQAFADFAWYDVDGVVCHKLPLETENAIPPVFLTFTLSRPGKDDLKINVALVDTKGEGWVKHDPNVTSFINSCDGVIYFTEPKQSTRLVHIVNQDQATASNAFQNGPVQAGYEREGMPLLFNAGAEERASDSRNKLIGSADIFNAFFQRTTSPINPETPIAFVLTKFDQIIDEKQYVFQKESEPVFFDHLREFKDPVQRRKLMDNSEMFMHNMAATDLFYKIFPELNISSSNYRNVACFCTSSFTGEPVNGYITEEQFQKAYNIHLPFIWLLSKIIDFDGTKKQDVFQPEEETEATSSRSFSRQSAPEGERRNRRHRSANNSSENKSNARRVNELIDDD